MKISGSSLAAEGEEETAATLKNSIPGCRSVGQSVWRWRCAVFSDL